jgi:hypothetical protein
MGNNIKTGERVIMLKNFSDIFPKVDDKKKNLIRKAIYGSNSTDVLN